MEDGTFKGLLELIDGGFGDVASDLFRVLGPELLAKSEMSVLGWMVGRFVWSNSEGLVEAGCDYLFWRGRLCSTGIPPL